MNILSRVTWKAMWKNRTRTVVTVIGVILSAAMFMAITSLAASGLDYLRRYFAESRGDYYCSFEGLEEEELEELANLPEVSEIGTMKSIGYCVAEPTDGGMTTRFLIAACNDTYFRNMPLQIEEGRLPQNSSEILLDGNNLNILERAGYPTALGATVTLPVTVGLTSPGAEPVGPEGEAPEEEPVIVERTYTVVGVGTMPAVPQLIGPDTVFLAWMYTYDDGAQGEAFAINAYVKTDPVRASLELFHSDYGTGRVLEAEYLACFGVIDSPVNILTLLAILVGGLCAIVLLGSVSLIYNAFSISVTERTKQFGLLRSVGATKKQLRRSLLFEALVVGGIGIPLGLLAGYGGAALLVNGYRWELDKLFSLFGDYPGISVQVVFSWQAMLLAAAIALVAVLLSAWIPARRATKIAPLEAIRQTEDYKIGKKLRKTKKSRLFGFPGTLAKRYYATSRKKYRSVVVSLAISLTIFIATMSVTQLFLDVTLAQSGSGYNYDIKVHNRNNPEALEALRQQPFVTQSVLVYNNDMSVAVREDMYSDAMLDCWEKLYYEAEVLGLGAFESGISTVTVQHLEDEAFLALLQENGIRDTSPYFEEGKALALNISGAVGWDNGTEEERFVFNDLPVLSPEVTQLCMVQSYMRPQIDPFSFQVASYYTYYLDEAGQVIMKWVNLETEEIVCHLMRQEERDGVSGIAYYHYAPGTGITDEEPFYFWEREKIETVPIYGCANGVPFGIYEPNRYNLVLVAPLSTLEGGTESAGLAIDVNDYQAAIEYLENHEMDYLSYIGNEMNARMLAAAIQTFVSCFVAVISLICAANIFNTVSTNVSLRRRDFGMLQSLGMQKKQLLSMLVCETAVIGVRALGWGLGVGVLIHCTFCQITRSAAYVPFALPWAVMGVAVLAVVVLITAATAYAFAKMKKDNPIEAIRQENT